MMTMQYLDHPSQGWRCEKCGLPGVRVSTRPNDNSAGAQYKCVPCNRTLGACPCTTPGARVTSTCPCGERRGSDSSTFEGEVPRGVSMLSMGRKNSLNPHNPEPGFDEDWEANCSPGFMVSRFKASGEEIIPRF